MGIVTFNGVSSKDFGIQVETPPGYQMPKKDYDKYHVPGKNGDVIIYKNSYQNVTRQYKIAIGDLDRNFVDLANSVSEWLNSSYGYARLEDSYEPDYYRLAIYEDANEITNVLQHAGRATIKFNCKPQRFLKSGDKSISIKKRSVATTLKNPTKFTSLPIITIKSTGDGPGKVTINDQVIKVTPSTESEGSFTIVVDSSVQDCYYGSTNMNSYITLSNGFPKLNAGNNSISYDSAIMSVEVIPKWWTI